MAKEVYGDDGARQGLAIPRGNGRKEGLRFLVGRRPDVFFINVCLVLSARPSLGGGIRFNKKRWGRERLLRRGTRRTEQKNARRDENPDNKNIWAYGIERAREDNDYHTAGGRWTDAFPPWYKNQTSKNHTRS